MSTPLEDYALLGDCETAALVSSAGSIDWLCWPRFDSGSCFAALLGTPENGRWLVTAADENARVTRRYRPNTLILETTFETADGAATVIDFMPPRGKNSDIVRLVRGDRGRVRMLTELILRFDHGRIVPWVTRLDHHTTRAIAGPDMITLRTPVAVHGQDFTTAADFDVEEGKTVPFVLTHGRSHLDPPDPIDPMRALGDTEAFWTEWVNRSPAQGPWAEAVTRSLITLKALTYAPTGGIVAAPTTSLPEKLGGQRNWDYRFCWLRDATFTLLALMNAGYHEEAGAWRDWLLRAAAGSPAQIQIMYGLAGERSLIEYEVPWLAGYEGSQPVRIGNAAHSQLQLDVFGEVMDAMHQAHRGGITSQEADWELQRAMIDRLIEIWEEPDHGMWEVRDRARHFTSSKMMAWVALDRMVRSAETFGLQGPVEQWRVMRQTIHDDVCRRGFNRRMNSFVQSYGSRHLDASLLLMPMVGFLPIDDPRVRGTVDAVEKQLFVDGFVLRYDTHRSHDGLPPGEGVFLACTFWLADVYVLMDRYDEAKQLFERLLALRNDVGLLSEEYDPGDRRLIGNFPQAFSHVALVNTAHNLTGARKPAEQRSHP